MAIVAMAAMAKNDCNQSQVRWFFAVHLWAMFYEKKTFGKLP